jgi:hypothetical protein
MEKYRKIMKSEALKEPSQPLTTAVAYGSPIKGRKMSRLGYVNLGLPSKYQHAADMEWPSQSGSQSTGERSVENEYQMYIVGALTKMDINLLKFWEVGCFHSSYKQN